MKKSRNSGCTSTIFPTSRLGVSSGLSKPSGKYPYPVSLRSSQYTDAKENVPLQLGHMIDYKMNYEDGPTFGKH